MTVFHVARALSRQDAALLFFAAFLDVSCHRRSLAMRAVVGVRRVVKAEDVEYTTAKSLSDQGSSQDDDLLDDFDMRLQSTKK